MKILCIGNSFSCDATRYLHQIARSQKEAWQISNLYIGGCSLERHFRNMLTGLDAYELYHNGNATGFCVSIKEALLSRSWDVVTLQQASHFSPDYATYQPYLSRLAQYIRELCPKAKLYIHQTWAYEANSAKLESICQPTPDAMFAALESAYAQAARDICADGLIPSGKLMLTLSQAIGRVHRDTFHASLGAGRLALGLLWYRILSGKAAAPFLPDLDEAVTPQELETIFSLVASL